FEDPLKRHSYLCTQWAGTEMGSIDPLKEAKAHEVEILSGVKSRRSIVESQGRDFDKQAREHEVEKNIFSDPDIGQMKGRPGKPANASSPSKGLSNS
ncbi:MAG: hypothetical protein M3Q07_08625, partial [Pseudobdellovibrionaceae bacterium]|nr:hypothetical protein [Pseudobdellovibrionaceae bacterium]